MRAAQTLTFPPEPRGSRRHVLEWTTRSTFAQELAELLLPVEVRIDPTDTWMPRGRAAPREARLETFGPGAILDHAIWPQLRTWWLGDVKGNTPNWDIASSCTIDARKGLVLVEAKANRPELKTEGKKLPGKPSVGSRRNQKQIESAINDACDGFKRLDPSCAISHTSHYQLANRLAFAWRLASAGIPVVLVYLGFLGDSGVANVGAPFTTHDDWVTVAADYMSGQLPKALLEKRLDLDAPMWVLLRSRFVLSQSPRH